MSEGTAPVNWDEPIEAAGGEGALNQTVFQGQVFKAIDKSIPVFLRVWDGNELLASLMMLRKEAEGALPYQPMFDRFKNYVAGLSKESLNWVAGPVLYNPDRATEALDYILDWVDDYAQNNQITIINADSLARTGELCKSQDIAEIYRQHGYNIGRWGTILMDLTADEDTIWQRIKNRRHRQAISKARRSGATIFKINTIDELRTRYFEPYVKIRLEEGLAPPSFTAFRATLEEDHKGRYSFFVAEDENQVTLALGGMYMFNNIAAPLAIAISSEARLQKIPAMDLLYWEMMMIAKSFGAHTFDMAGTKPNPQSDKEKGIRFTKEKWGGAYVEFYIFNKRSKYSMMMKRIWGMVNKVASAVKHKRS